jgi:hypothetical protein
MAEFYMESQFLDLKKKYQDFVYESLYDKDAAADLNQDPNIT